MHANVYSYNVAYVYIYSHMWLDLWKLVQIAQELKSILLPNIKATLWRTKHMAKDGQVCFHRRLFADPVKPQRCTTEPVRPLDGVNKDVGGVKLLLATTSVYPVDCACICPLLKTQHHCLCPNGRCNPPSASRHPPPTPLYTPFLIIQ